MEIDNENLMDRLSARSSDVRNKSFRHSLGLGYLFGEDDEQLARQKSDDSQFPKHVQNSGVLTVFLLLNTMIGSGILNQPQVFMEAGVVSAVVMLIIAAIFTWLGLAALVDTGVAHNIYDFSSLAKFAFGRWGEIVVDVCIAFGNFGALLSYIIVIGSTCTDLLDSWGCPISGCSEYLMTTLLIAIFVTPVCLKRVFGELAIYSVVSMISIGSIVALTVIGGPIVGSGGSVALVKSAGLLSQLGSIIFALSCSFATFHTYISLKDASALKWRQLSACAMVLGVIMLFVIGIGEIGADCL